MASVSDTLLDAAVSLITSLNLTLAGGQAATVRKRKLPRVGESIEETLLPLIIVCPAEHPGVDYPFDSGDDVNPGSRYREYPVQVVIVSVGNADNLTWLSDYQDWRQKIGRAFGQIDPLPTQAETLMQTQVDPGAVLDRGALNALYDYSVIGIRFCCVEPAGP